MTRNISEEEKTKKRTIFEGMSPRRQKHIVDKAGYDKWDPFIEPHEPIDIRKDKTKRTGLQLAREFLATCDHEKYSNAYGQELLKNQGQA